MSVIDSYLDTLFHPYPDSPAMRDARTELRAMMEDKQDGLMADGLSESQAVGQVIAEFGSLEEVAPVLGIEREVAGASQQHKSAAAPPAPGVEEEHLPEVDLPSAERYAETMRATQHLTALAVPLFVLAPAPLFAILALADQEDILVFLGLFFLLALVAIGVVLLTLRGSRLRAAAEPVVEENFRPGPGVLRYAEGLRAEHRAGAGRALGVAVVLWILAATPLLFTALLDREDQDLVLLGLIGTLIMVATGLFLWIRGAWADWAASALLREVDEEDPVHSSSAIVRVIAAVYWPVVVAIFLLWGLGFDGWGTAWILFPVAGVLYGAFWVGNAALVSSSRR
ncbi:MAG: permease prefix domain 1-containing protein [Brachybacterium sp.]|nr:permease prefix domain 1-containing protein [Brachybacterium sp.]